MATGKKPDRRTQAAPRKRAGRPAAAARKQPWRPARRAKGEGAGAAHAAPDGRPGTAEERTVAALHANGFERAVALEPEPRNLRLLSINLAANGLSERVQTLPVAISSAPGKGRLVVAEKRFGVHEIAERGEGADAAHTIEID